MKIKTSKKGFVLLVEEILLIHFENVCMVKIGHNDISKKD